MAYRVALIGGGSIAGSHLEALRSQRNMQAVAIADAVPEKAEEWASAYGIRAYADYRIMIEREKPDVAVILLPHFLHKEAAVFCAQLGCHILLEKPMALSTVECDEIIHAVRENGVKLMVGHTQHYLQQNMAAKAVLKEGGLGELVMINDTRHAYYFDTGRPDWFFEKAKAGGGILSNLGAHSIDKIQWLSGGKITKVRAALSWFGDRGDVEGSGLVFAINENGVPLSIAQSGYQCVPKDETELVFTGGMVKLVARQGIWISEAGVYKQLPLDHNRNPFELQFEDLWSYIEDGKEPECSMSYARSVVAVIEQIYRSHELGKEMDVIHRD